VSCLAGFWLKARVDCLAVDLAPFCLLPRNFLRVELCVSKLRNVLRMTLAEKMQSSCAVASLTDIRCTYPRVDCFALAIAAKVGLKVRRELISDALFEGRGLWPRG
jgi:hypothetical protein